MFFLSCFSFAVGIAVLYYYGGESYRQMEKCLDLFILGHLKLLLTINNFIHYIIIIFYDLVIKASSKTKPFKLFDFIFNTYFPLCCCHSFCPQRVRHWEALIRSFTALQQDLVKALKMFSFPKLRVGKQKKWGREGVGMPVVALWEEQAVKFATSLCQTHTHVES